MKSLDWAAVLENHPLLQSLDRQERSTLLSEPFSAEREYPEGSVILKEGETGNSLFIVGEGAVSIVLRGLHDEEATLYTLRQGEMFGEMALFEQRPRSATVIATEPSTLLEIDGDQFLALMQKHHEIALFLLAKLSQRLRFADDEILAHRMKGLDETIGILNSRVDGIVQATDAKLAASQVMFDETNKRANEIIESAGRARNRATWLAGIATVVLAVLAAIGYSDLKDIEREVNFTRNFVEEDRRKVAELRDTIEGDVSLAEEAAETAGGAASRAEGFASTAGDAATTAGEAQASALGSAESIAGIREKALEAHADVIFVGVKIDISENKDAYFSNRTEERYTKLVNSDNSDILDELFDFIHFEILEGADITGLLQLSMNRKENQTPNAVIITHYFNIFSSIIKYNTKKFDKRIAELNEYIEANKRAFRRPFHMGTKELETVKAQVISNESVDARKSEKSLMFDQLIAIMAQVQPASN